MSLVCLATLKIFFLSPTMKEVSLKEFVPDKVVFHLQRCLKLAWFQSMHTSALLEGRPAPLIDFRQRQLIKRKLIKSMARALDPENNTNCIDLRIIGSKLKCDLCWENLAERCDWGEIWMNVFLCSADSSCSSVWVVFFWDMLSRDSFRWDTWRMSPQ